MKAPFQEILASSSLKVSTNLSSCLINLYYHYFSQQNPLNAENKTDSHHTPYPLEYLSLLIVESIPYLSPVDLFSMLYDHFANFGKSSPLSSQLEKDSSLEHVKPARLSFLTELLGSIAEKPDLTEYIRYNYCFTSFPPHSAHLMATFPPKQSSSTTFTRFHAFSDYICSQLVDLKPKVVIDARKERRTPRGLAPTPTAAVPTTSVKDNSGIYDDALQAKFEKTRLQKDTINQCSVRCGCLEQNGFFDQVGDFGKVCDRSATGNNEDSDINQADPVREIPQLFPSQQVLLFFLRIPINVLPLFQLLCPFIDEMIEIFPAKLISLVFEQLDRLLALSNKVGAGLDGKFQLTRYSIINHPRAIINQANYPHNYTSISSFKNKPIIYSPTHHNRPNNRQNEFNVNSNHDRSVQIATNARTPLHLLSNDTLPFSSTSSPSFFPTISLSDSFPPKTDAFSNPNIPLKFLPMLAPTLEIFLFRFFHTIHPRFDPYFEPTPPWLRLHHPSSDDKNTPIEPFVFTTPPLSVKNPKDMISPATIELQNDPLSILYPLQFSLRQALMLNLLSHLGINITKPQEGQILDFCTQNSSSKTTIIEYSQAIGNLKYSPFFISMACTPPHCDDLIAINKNSSLTDIKLYPYFWYFPETSSEEFQHTFNSLFLQISKLPILPSLSSPVTSLSSFTCFKNVVNGIFIPSKTPHANEFLQSPTSPNNGELQQISPPRRRGRPSLIDKENMRNFKKAPPNLILQTIQINPCGQTNERNIFLGSNLNNNPTNNNTHNDDLSFVQLNDPSQNPNPTDISSNGWPRNPLTGLQTTNKHSIFDDVTFSNNNGNSNIPKNVPLPSEYSDHFTFLGDDTCQNNQSDHFQNHQSNYFQSNPPNNPQHNPQNIISKTPDHNDTSFPSVSNHSMNQQRGSIFNFMDPNQPPHQDRDLY
jgi:hypothetical protein